MVGPTSVPRPASPVVWPGARCGRVEVSVQEEVLRVGGTSRQTDSRQENCDFSHTIYFFLILRRLIPESSGLSPTISVLLFTITQFLCASRPENAQNEDNLSNPSSLWHPSFEGYGGETRPPRQAQLSHARRPRFPSPGRPAGQSRSRRRSGSGSNAPGCGFGRPAQPATGKTAAPCRIRS